MTTEAPADEVYTSRAVAKAFGVMYIARACLALMSFLLGIFIVRGLTKPQYALLHTFLALAVTLNTVTTLGIPAGLGRYVPELLVEGKKRLVRRLLLLALAGRLAAVSCGLVLLGLFWARLAASMNVGSHGRMLLWLVASQLVLSSVNDIAGKAYLNSTMRQATYQGFRVLGDVARLALCFAIIWRDPRVSYLLGAYVLGTLIQTVLFARVAVKSLSAAALGPSLPQDHGLPYGRMARYSSRLYIGTVGSAVLHRSFDVFLLVFLVSQARVAEYAFCTAFATQIVAWLPCSMVAGALIPAVVGKYVGMERGDADRLLGHVFSCTLKVLLWLAVPLFVGGALLSEEIIRYVYDPKYVAVSNVFAVAMLFSIARVASYALDPIIQPKEATHIYMVQAAVSAVKLVLVFALVPALGVMGLAVSSGCSYVAVCVAGYLLMARHVRVAVPWPSVLRICANAACMALVVYLARDLIHNLAGLLLVVALGGVTYLSVSAVNRVLSGHERVEVRRALRLPALPL